jgi:hypothetical protein
VSFGALHGVSLSGCRASSQHQEVRRRAEGRLQDGGREKEYGEGGAQWLARLLE